MSKFRCEKCGEVLPRDRAILCAACDGHEDGPTIRREVACECVTSELERPHPEEIESTVQRCFCVVTARLGATDWRVAALTITPVATLGGMPRYLVTLIGEREEPQ